MRGATNGLILMRLRPVNFSKSSWVILFSEFQMAARKMYFLEELRRASAASAMAALHLFPFNRRWPPWGPCFLEGKWRVSAFPSRPAQGEKIGLSAFHGKWCWNQSPVRYPHVSTMTSRHQDPLRAPASFGRPWNQRISWHILRGLWAARREAVGHGIDRRSTNERLKFEGSHQRNAS